MHCLVKKIGIRGIKTANNHSSAGEILIFLNVHHKGYSTCTKVQVMASQEVFIYITLQCTNEKLSNIWKQKEPKVGYITSYSHRHTAGFRGLQMLLPHPMQYRGEVEGVSKIMSRSNSFNLTPSGA